MPLWLPLMVIASIAILITSGWPVTYLSKRYVLKDTYRTVVKFRTMVRNAAQLANRDTVPHDPNRMLNIIIDDSLYTPLGKFFDKIHVSEMPQLIQVIFGTLTLVGNRPMPENMVNKARAVYPFLEERFSVPGGITGPAQLCGRENLTDIQRLELEITYCYLCQESYSPLLDIHLLLLTFLLPFHKISRQRMLDLMYSYTKNRAADNIKQRVSETINC